MLHPVLPTCAQRQALHLLLELLPWAKSHCCTVINERVWQAGAAGAIAAGHDCWGSFLFCLSLNHKQMSMYYAPAFFAHLLGRCLQRPTWSGKVQTAQTLYKLLTVLLVLNCTSTLKRMHGTQRTSGARATPVTRCLLSAHAGILR